MQKIFWSHLCVRKSLKIIFMTFRSFSPHPYSLLLHGGKCPVYSSKKCLCSIEERKSTTWGWINDNLFMCIFVWSFIVFVCTFWIISSSCSRYSLLMLYCCSSTREKCSIRVIESFSFRVITMSWWRTH